MPSSTAAAAKLRIPYSNLFECKQFAVGQSATTTSITFGLMIGSRLRLLTGTSNDW